jgi:hypothetical protein
MNCFKLPQKRSKGMFFILLIAGAFDMSCVRPRSLKDGSVVAVANNPAMDEYWTAINKLVGNHKGKRVKARVGDVEVEMNLSTGNFWGLNLSNLKDDNGSVAVYFKSDRRQTGPDISFNWFNEDFSQFGFFGDNDPQQADKEMQKPEFLRGLEAIEDAAFILNNNDLKRIFWALHRRLNGKYEARLLKQSIETPKIKTVLFKGVDNQNQACYVAIEQTFAGAPLKMRLMSAATPNPETVSLLWFLNGGVVAHGDDNCHSFEVDLTQSAAPGIRTNLGFKNPALLGAYATSSWNRALPNGGGASSTTVGLGVSVLSQITGSCERTTIRICDNAAHASHKKTSFGFFPWLLKHFQHWTAVPEEAIPMDLGLAFLFSFTNRSGTKDYTCKDLAPVNPGNPAGT